MSDGGDHGHSGHTGHSGLHSDDSGPSLSGHRPASSGGRGVLRRAMRWETFALLAIMVILTIVAS
ncbi:hypothetical protein ACWC9R_04400 [Streptomyces sp. NPDC001219]